MGGGDRCKDTKETNVTHSSGEGGGGGKWAEKAVGVRLPTSYLVTFLLFKLCEYILYSKIKPTHFSSCRL